MTAFDSARDTQTAWRSVRLDDGSAALRQMCRNKDKHWYPAIVAGDRVWQDDTVTANVHVEDTEGRFKTTANFWKNQGLIHILDHRGNVVADFEPRPEHGSSMVPVHWKGDGSELIFVLPDPVHGGLFDGSGHKAVKLPADGHPSKAYDALDLTGDSRDELIVWDSQEIGIYTQDRECENLQPAPIRNSLSNESNYRARVSVSSNFKSK